MFQLVMSYNDLISIKMDSVMPALYEAFEKTKISMGLDSTCLNFCVIFEEKYF